MPADVAKLETDAVEMLANLAKDTDFGKALFVLGIIGIAALRISDSMERGTQNVATIADHLRVDKPPV